MSEISYGSEDIHTNAWKAKIEVCLGVTDVFKDNPESGDTIHNDYAAFVFEEKEELYFDVSHPLTQDPEKNKYSFSVWRVQDDEPITLYENTQVSTISINEIEKSVTIINDKPDEAGIAKTIVYPGGKIVSVMQNGESVVLYE